MALVFADADGFGERMPQLPVYPAYRNGSIAGYAFFSADIMDSAGYSAKPMNVAIGLDLQGRIVGAHLVEHHEPILILGITDDHLRAFVAQYRNVDIREPVKLRSVCRIGRIDTGGRWHQRRHDHLADAEWPDRRIEPDRGGWRSDCLATDGPVPPQSFRMSFQPAELGRPARRRINRRNGAHHRCGA